MQMQLNKERVHSLEEELEEELDEEIESILEAALEISQPPFIGLVRQVIRFMTVSGLTGPFKSRPKLNQDPGDFNMTWQGLSPQQQIIGTIMNF